MSTRLMHIRNVKSKRLALYHKIRELVEKCYVHPPDKKATWDTLVMKATVLYSVTEGNFYDLKRWPMFVEVVRKHIPCAGEIDNWQIYPAYLYPEVRHPDFEHFVNRGTSIVVINKTDGGDTHV